VTHYACGCIEVDAIRDPKDCTEGHDAATVAPGHEPEPIDTPKKTAAKKK
jgi:hypothetical protein